MNGAPSGTFPHLRLSLPGDDPTYPKEPHLREFVKNIDKLTEWAVAEQEKKGRGLAFVSWNAKTEKVATAYCPLTKLSERTFLDLGLSGEVFLDVIETVQTYPTESRIPVLTFTLHGDHYLADVNFSPDRIL